MSPAGQDRPSPTDITERSDLLRRPQQALLLISTQRDALIDFLWGNRLTAPVAALTMALMGVALLVVGSDRFWSQAATTVSRPVEVSVSRSQAQVPDDPEASPTPAETPQGSDAATRSSLGRSDSARQVGRHPVNREGPREGIVTHRVGRGDTVPSIAERFGLDPTTIMWANPAVEDAPDLLRIGQEIIILPIDGVYHWVEEGDTLSSIAEAYGVDEAAIVRCRFNDLGTTGREVRPGTALIVPGGEKPYEAKNVPTYSGQVPEGAQGSGQFQWPVTGRITQQYWHGHRAIDVGAPTGSAVTAADAGFVSFAGWSEVGYGNLIVINHGNEFVTYYAHLSKIYVGLGQAVTRGQVVGAVGNTGNSTGPHLHFEVRRQNRQQNPYAYLP